MKFEKILNHTFSWVIKIDNYNGRSVGCNVVKSGLAWVSGLPKGLGERRGDVKRGRGEGRRERAPVKASVSGVPLLSLPSFFAFLLPLFPQKRLILRLNLDIRPSDWRSIVCYFTHLNLTETCVEITTQHNLFLLPFHCLAKSSDHQGSGREKTHI